MKTQRLVLIMMLTLIATGAHAQQSLTLDTCRARALRTGNAMQRSALKQEETAALQQVALWQMLPKVSANGGYMWMEKSVNLLSDEQKDKLNHLGGTVQEDLSAAAHRELDDLLPIGGERLADRLDALIANSGISNNLDQAGQDIVQGLETDTRNTSFVTVTLTQPIYLGGKLLAAYRTARLVHELSGVEYNKEREATLLAVDEAFWQVVSLQQKKQLAEQYAALLDTLERNVNLAFEAEMATKGDLAKVRVKRNEAQINLSKATNGLILSKMLLAQRCGMPLHADFEVNGEVEMQHIGPSVQHLDVNENTMADVYARRGEMRMLGISDSIAREGVRIAASSLKPNVVLTGGYLASNPNVFDGFSNSWGGTAFAGVAVNVPLVHIGGVYALKAAKAKRREVALQVSEARQLIELQVRKSVYELDLAYRKEVQALSLVEQAEENLRLADESFKSGMCSSSDLMAAQTAWMQAQNEVIDARIEIAMGKVYLKQAMGISNNVY